MVGGVKRTGRLAGHRVHGDGSNMTSSAGIANETSCNRCSAVSTAMRVIMRPGRCAGHACGPALHARCERLPTSSHGSSVCTRGSLFADARPRISASPRWIVLPAELAVDQRVAGRHVRHRRVAPQDLVQRVVDAETATAHPAREPGVGQHQPQRLRDPRGGGLVARGDHQHHRLLDLEVVAQVGVPQERGRQVVGRHVAGARSSCRTGSAPGCAPGPASPPRRRTTRSARHAARGPARGRCRRTRRPSAWAPRPRSRPPGPPCPDPRGRGSGRCRWPG